MVLVPDYVLGKNAFVAYDIFCLRRPVFRYNIDENKRTSVRSANAFWLSDNRLSPFVHYAVSTGSWFSNEKRDSKTVYETRAYRLFSLLKRFCFVFSRPNESRPMRTCNSIAYCIIPLRRRKHCSEGTRYIYIELSFHLSNYHWTSRR